MEDAAEDGGWIRVTHVGSLPRRKGASVEEMVAQQLDAGISVVNDGEMERPDYISDVLSRLEGCGRVAGKEGEVIMPMAADMADAPAHARRFTGINGLITLNAASPARSGLICTAKPEYSANGAAQVSAALAPLLAATKANGLPPSSAFWSVPSPGTLALFAANAAFPGDYTAYVSALGDALAGEYEAVAATGVMLQVDAPDLAMGRHTRHAALSDAEFLSTVVAANVTALNRALARVPTAKTRVHVCWGNYPGPHTRDLDAELLWPHLLKLKVRAAVDPSTADCLSKPLLIACHRLSPPWPALFPIINPYDV
jgi:5-methyltetrahydropteroyltriglutamate--homocysteine methyltransferase